MQRELKQHPAYRITLRLSERGVPLLCWAEFTPKDQQQTYLTPQECRDLAAQLLTVADKAEQLGDLCQTSSEKEPNR